MNNKLKILALDGGGIRGIIPCTILAEIEQMTGKRAGDLFDLIAGTSTGGIIGIGLNAPNPKNSDGTPFSASELLAMYAENGARIFKKKGFLFNLGGTTEETFEHSGLEEVLQEFFGDAELKNCRTELLVTSYDIQKRMPFYFLSRLAKEKPEEENFYLRHVARSTSAAPTYFEPNLVQWVNGDALALVDGGVFANNPAMLAYTEAINLMRLRQNGASVKRYEAKPAESEDLALESFSAQVATSAETSEYFMLSIGTGKIARPYRYEDARDWGAVSWLRPILDILMQGVSESVHYQMEYVLPATVDGKRNYYRLNPEVPTENSEMSDVSAGNIAKLQEIAKQYVQQNRKMIEDICAAL